MMEKILQNSLMKRCCKLAEKGLGLTVPNPIVGAILLDKNNKIIAEGYHKKYGKHHAEIDAILNAKMKGISDLSDCSLLVSLEPCNHYGKQPPCTEAIINAGIKKIYVGIEDPNPLVSGKGITRLKEAGINVVVGIAEKECTRILADYIHYITKGMPYITLKIAQSIDGFIANNEGWSKYITSEESRKEVHRMRSYCSVLVGINTILKDNPILDSRLVTDENDIGKKNITSNIIILDSNLRTPHNSKIFSIQENRRIFIAYSENLDTDISEIKEQKKALEKQGAILIKSQLKDNKIHLRKLLSLLSLEYNITHILVEGGGKVFSSFINSQLFNRLIIYTAPMIIGNGIKAFSDVDIKIMNEILNKCDKKYSTQGKDIVTKINKT